MKIRAFVLTAAATAILATTGAIADPNDHHPGPGWNDHQRGPGDWNGRPGWHWRDDRGGWHADHDRYWRHGYGRYAGHDVFFRTLRFHHYYRWDGDPYWFQGRFVIRTYDRFGRPIFVELNPYTGDFIGVIRF